MGGGTVHFSTRQFDLMGLTVLINLIHLIDLIYFSHLVDVIDNFDGYRLFGGT